MGQERTLARPSNDPVITARASCSAKASWIAPALLPLGLPGSGLMRLGPVESSPAPSIAARMSFLQIAGGNVSTRKPGKLPGFSLWNGINGETFLLYGHRYGPQHEKSLDRHVRMYRRFVWGVGRFSGPIRLVILLYDLLFLLVAASDDMPFHALESLPQRLSILMADARCHCERYSTLARKNHGYSSTFANRAHLRSITISRSIASVSGQCVSPGPTFGARRLTWLRQSELSNVCRNWVSISSTPRTPTGQVSEQLIRDTLYPYEGILIATKAGLTRPGPGEWERDGRPGTLARASHSKPRPTRA